MPRTAFALAGAILSFTFTSIGAQTPPPFRLLSLNHGVWAAIDNPEAKDAESGANAGFLIGATGVAVIDTFENVDAAKAMLKVIQEKTKLPIRFVINTHYHLDHVAGNATFRSAGAVILAQENVRLWSAPKTSSSSNLKSPRSSTSSLSLSDYPTHLHQGGGGAPLATARTSSCA